MLMMVMIPMLQQFQIRSVETLGVLFIAQCVSVSKLLFAMVVLQHVFVYFKRFLNVIVKQGTLLL